MTEPFVGQIQTFGFNFNPRGWQLCSGQLMSISQNTALFSLLGTTYGGDGITNFALPDLRGRVPVGQGQQPGRPSYVMGQTGGSDTVTLTSNQMPAHIHAAVATPHTHTCTATSTLYAERVAGTVGNPTGNMLAGGTTMYIPPAPSNNVALDTGSIVTTNVNDATTVTVTIGATGGSQPFTALSPYTCVNMSIAIEGIFPSRN